LAFEVIDPPGSELDDLRKLPADVGCGHVLSTLLLAEVGSAASVFDRLLDELRRLPLVHLPVPFGFDQVAWLVVTSTATSLAHR
jgi:hypothetical protein